MSFIAPDNHFAIFTILVAASAFGILGERKHWFKNVSGIVVTIFITSIFVTLNVLPSATDQAIEVGTYDFVFDYIVPISIPLLLFNVNLKKIIKESGRLLVIFLIGALGVVIGAIAAFYLIDIGAEAYKLAGVFIGTYTGGSVNFMAVGTSLEFLNSPLYPATVVVDNVFTNFFVMFLFMIPGIKFLQKKYFEYKGIKENPFHIDDSIKDSKEEHFMEKMAIAISIAGLVCAIGFWLSGALTKYLNIGFNIDLLVITALITLIANIFPNQLQKFEKVAFDLGMLLMFIFLAAIGASCNLMELLKAAPGVLLFAIITLTVHFIVIMLGGKLLKVSLKEIVVASVANIGGPSMAAPTAAALNMKDAVSPAILIGILGYVIGTFLGTSIGALLQ